MNWGNELVFKKQTESREWEIMGSKWLWFWKWFFCASYDYYVYHITCSSKQKTAEERFILNSRRAGSLSHCEAGNEYQNKTFLKTFCRFHKVVYMYDTFNVYCTCNLYSMLCVFCVLIVFNLEWVMFRLHIPFLS